MPKAKSERRLHGSVELGRLLRAHRRPSRELQIGITKVCSRLTVLAEQPGLVDSITANFHVPPMRILTQVCQMLNYAEANQDLHVDSLRGVTEVLLPSGRCGRN